MNSRNGDNMGVNQRVSTEDDLGSAKIESLPDELLLNIFSYFDIQELFKSAHVNKKFRQISNDKSFWIQVNLCNQKVPCEFIDQILRNETEYLNLHGAILLGNAGELPKNQLKYLNLTKCNVDDDFLVRLLRSCENLQKLRLPEVKMKCWRSHDQAHLDSERFGSKCTSHR